MEAVQRPREHVHLVVDVVGLQRRLVLGPHGVDARIRLRVDDHQRRLDLRHVRRGRRGAVERHAGLQVAAELGREPVGHAAAPTEAGGAQAPVGQSVPLQETRAVDHVLIQRCRIDAPLQRAAVVVVAGVAAHRRQPVGGQRQEAGDRGAPRHVLDVRIEAAVLVNDQHGRERPVAGRLHEVPAHLAGRAARRGVIDVGPLHARIREGDGLRLGVPRHQRLRHPERGDAADGEGRGAAQKLSPVDVAVAILVVEVEDAPVDFLLFFCHRRTPG